MRVVFTNKPIRLFSPMSWVNAITRWKTKSPFDHVAIEYGGAIYESTSGRGVSSISFEEWKSERVGSYLFIYEDDDSLYDMSVFYSLKGQKYDYMANVYYLFGLTKWLGRSRSNRQFCSELIMRIKHRHAPFLYTPEDIEEELRFKKAKSIIDKVV